tara:strand:- start:2053 stop:2907 length:855 start_codon:yes stop_codon:yes gene_type:complete
MSDPKAKEIIEQSHDSQPDENGVRKGEENLTVSPSVPGQEWCVMSFVTPGDTAKEFKMYMYDHFLQDTINEYLEASTRDMCRRINAKFFKSMEDRIAKMEKSKNENHQEIAKEMTLIRKELETNEEEFANLCTHKHAMNLDDTMAKFEDFEIKNGEKLQQDFEKENGRRPTVMGIKFDGAYPFMEQAEERAKFLAENVERGVHHFIAQSFHWCPFDPNADAVKEQRYQHKELNRLMEEQRRNQEMKDRFFQERKQEMMQDAQTKNADLKERLRKKYKARRERRK